MEVADNMKKQGGFIPGIRPGKSTVDYLKNLLSYIIFIGAAGLTIVAVIPFFFNGFFKANVSFDVWYFAFSDANSANMQFQSTVCASTASTFLIVLLYNKEVLAALNVIER